jgi:hypothetical protein
MIPFVDDSDIETFFKVSGNIKWMNDFKHDIIFDNFFKERWITHVEEKYGQWVLGQSRQPYKHVTESGQPTMTLDQATSSNCEEN